MDKSLDKAIRIIIETAQPDRIILFGSRASGDNRDSSDYDLCILKTGVRKKRKLAQRLYRALYGVGIAIDIIVETPKRFETDRANPYLIFSDIARNGKVIYEKPKAG